MNVTFFDALFSIFREFSSIEDTWVSSPTPNYEAEAINSCPYPHDYVFIHVALDYEYPQPRTITFQCMYGHDTNFNITAIRLRKFYVIKVDVYRTYEIYNASTTYLFMATYRTKYPQINVSPPYIAYESYAVGERMNERQRQSRRAASRPNI